MDKDSILASLTGDQIDGNDNRPKINITEQDLFGDIAIHHSSVAVDATHGTVTRAPLPPGVRPNPKKNQIIVQDEEFTGSGHVAAVQLEAPTANPISDPSASSVQDVIPVDSLLSRSGLLGISGIPNDSRGLFDEVDECERIEVKGNMKKQNIRKGGMENRKKQEEVASKKTEEQYYRMQSLQEHQHQPLRNADCEHHLVPSIDTKSMPTSDQKIGIMQNAVMSQRQLNNQMSTMTLNSPETSGFYRQHGISTDQQIQGARMPIQSESGINTSQNSGSYYYGTREQQIQHPTQQQHYSGSFAKPSLTAGMHNSAQDVNLGRIRKVEFVKPQEVPPVYVDIRVTEPMLIQTQSFLISSPPYWSYQITSQLTGNLGTWLVRRRFRHVVALEDRLRQACPGSIIPPRPEKHATRALEEASTQQSAEFAVQRSKELEQYLNQLARHPVVGQCQVLRLFLGLQDDIGTAWPEVSTNALTRLQAVGAGVTMRVAESTNLTAASAPVHEWEDDAELLSLCSSENLRLGAVSQAVPKLEGTIIVLREQGDAAGILGMELSKVSKTLELEYKFYDILSSGLLRHGRRTKRLALEMTAAMESFLHQYKLVRYEKMAMQDRRQAIQRKAKQRGRADARAVYLTQQQRQLQVNGQMHHLNQLEQSAVSMDTHALDAVNEADKIGARLKLEINRVAIDRRIAWNSSIKTIASGMKDACSERLAIWESTLEAFENLKKNEGQP